MDVKVEEDALASEDAVTRCRCLRNEDQEGFMIECDTCHMWQHGRCMGIRDETEAPEKYLCYVCDPNLNLPLLSNHVSTTVSTRGAGRKPRGSSVKRRKNGPGRPPNNPQAHNTQPDWTDFRPATHRSSRRNEDNEEDPEEEEEDIKPETEDKTEHRRVKSVTAIRDSTAIVTPSNSALLSREEKKLQRIMQQFEMMEQKAGGSSATMPVHTPAVATLATNVPVAIAKNQTPVATKTHAPVVRTTKKRKVSQINTEKRVSLPSTFNIPCPTLSTYGYPLAPMHFGSNDPSVTALQPLKRRFGFSYETQKKINESIYRKTAEPKTMEVEVFNNEADALVTPAVNDEESVECRIKEENIESKGS